MTKLTFEAHAHLISIWFFAHNIEIELCDIIITISDPTTSSQKQNWPSMYWQLFKNWPSKCNKFIHFIFDIVTRWLTLTYMNQIYLTSSNKTIIHNRSMTSNKTILTKEIPVWFVLNNFLPRKSSVGNNSNPPSGPPLTLTQKKTQSQSALSTRELFTLFTVGTWKSHENPKDTRIECDRRIKQDQLATPHSREVAAP